MLALAACEGGGEVGRDNAAGQGGQSGQSPGGSAGQAGSGGSGGGGASGSPSAGASGQGGAWDPDWACVPGSTQACLGAGQCKGAQSCSISGLFWESCDCGAAGKGGGSGQGGQGGGGSAQSGGSSGAQSGGSSGAQSGGSAGITSCTEDCTGKACGTFCIFSPSNSPGCLGGFDEGYCNAHQECMPKPKDGSPLDCAGAGGSEGLRTCGQELDSPLCCPQDDRCSRVEDGCPAIYRCTSVGDGACGIGSGGTSGYQMEYVLQAPDAGASCATEGKQCLYWSPESFGDKALTTCKGGVLQKSTQVHQGSCDADVACSGDSFCRVSFDCCNRDCICKNGKLSCHTACDNGSGGACP